MTQKELLTHLKLGLKMKRKSWKGYLYIKDGEIVKRGESNKEDISVDIEYYFHPYSNPQDWYIYHEPEGS